MYVNKENLKHDFGLGIFILMIVIGSLLVAWFVGKIMQYKILALMFVISLFLLALILMIYLRYFKEATADNTDFKTASPKLKHS